MPDINAISRYRKKRFGEETTPVYGPTGPTGGTSSKGAVFQGASDDGGSVRLSWTDGGGGTKQVTVPKPSTPVTGGGTTAPVPSGLSSLSPKAAGIAPMGTSGTAEAYQAKLRMTMDRNTAPAPAPAAPSPTPSLPQESVGTNTAPAPSPGTVTPAQSAIPGVYTPPVMAKEMPKPVVPEAPTEAPVLSSQALGAGGAAASATKPVVPEVPAVPGVPTGVARDVTVYGGEDVKTGGTVGPAKQQSPRVGVGELRETEATMPAVVTPPREAATTPTGETRTAPTGGAATPPSGGATTTATGGTGQTTTGGTATTTGAKSPAQRYQDLVNESADRVAAGDLDGAWTALQAANTINSAFGLGNPNYTRAEAGLGGAPTPGGGGDGGGGTPKYDPATGRGEGNTVKSFVRDDAGNVIGYVGLDDKQHNMDGTLFTGGGGGTEDKIAGVYKGRTGTSTAVQSFLDYLKGRVGGLPSDADLRRQAELQGRQRFSANLASIQRARAQARGASEEEQRTLLDYRATAEKSITNWASRQRTLDAEQANRQGLFWGGYLGGLIASTEKAALDKIGSSNEEIGKQIANVARRLTLRLSELSDSEIAAMDEQQVYTELQYIEAQTKNKQERVAVEMMMQQLAIQLAQSEDAKQADYAAYLEREAARKTAATEAAAKTRQGTTDYTAIPGFPDYLNRQGISVTQFNAQTEATKGTIYAEYQREKAAGATQAQQPTFNYPDFNAWLRKRGHNPDVLNPADKEILFNVWQGEVTAANKGTTTDNNQTLQNYLSTLSRLTQLQGALSDPTKPMTQEEKTALAAERDNLLNLARFLAIELGLTLPPEVENMGGGGGGGSNVTPPTTTPAPATTTTDPALSAWVREQQQAGVPDADIAAELRANGVDPRRYGLKEQ